MIVEFIDKTNGSAKSIVINTYVVDYMVPGCRVICFDNLKVLRKYFC